jgi:hypothetical protein
MKTTIDMAREAGFQVDQGALLRIYLERFEALIRADEREACAKLCYEFARKWWKIHCDSNLHYSSTLKAHQDFCALQVAIRARGETK